MLYYTPSPDAAYRSMKDLQFVVPYGGSSGTCTAGRGHAMVVVVLPPHVPRVLHRGVQGAAPVQLAVMGSALLVLTLALSFTGYLLPWDQLAFWAITVGTSMAVVCAGRRAGGTVPPARRGPVGAGALLRFYVLHCAILPVSMLLLVVAARVPRAP